MINRLVLILAVLACSFLAFAAPPGDGSVVTGHGVALFVDAPRVGPVSPLGPVGGSLDFRLGQAAAPAPQTYSASGAYDIRNKRLIAYALLPSNAHWDVGSLTANIPDLPKFHLNIDLAPWAGPGVLGRGAVGYQATHSFALTRDRKYMAAVGFDGSFERGKVPEFDLFVFGLSVQLG